MNKKECIVITTPWLLQFMHAFLKSFEKIQWILFEPPTLHNPTHSVGLESLSFFSFERYNSLTLETSSPLQILQRTHTSAAALWQKGCPKPLFPIKFVSQIPLHLYPKITQIEDIRYLQDDHPMKKIFILSPFSNLGYENFNAQARRISLFGTYDKDVRLSFYPQQGSYRQIRWSIWAGNPNFMGSIFHTKLHSPFYLFSTPMPIIMESMLIYNDFFEKELKNIL